MRWVRHRALLATPVARGLRLQKRAAGSRGRKSTRRAVRSSKQFTHYHYRSSVQLAAFGAAPLRLLQNSSAQCVAAAFSGSCRLVAEEVLYLHSLWRRGPEVSAPAPAPIPPRGSGSAATRRVAARRRRRRLERRLEGAQEQESSPEWPLAPSPPASPTSWHVKVSSSSISQHRAPQLLQPSPGSLSQQAALRAAVEFFSRGSDEEEGSESEGEEEEEDTAAGFFMRLFERDAALREHYERSWEEGEFMCMVCAGRKWRKGKTRRFSGCVGLVQHACAVTRCGRPRAHRSLAAVICRVLGWDTERLPSVVIDPRGTLSQALATTGAITAQEHNADAGEKGVPSEDEDVAKEEVDTTKSDGSLGDVDAMKENVDVGKSSSSISDNNGEVCEKGNDEETAKQI